MLSPPVGRSASELIRQIAAFQHHQATGEVMPADWRPGAPTLTPSTDLVGNVWQEWKPEAPSESP